MTHGSSQALERSQRTTGNRMEVGGTWGFKDLVFQKVHSGSVQILEEEGMYKGNPKDVGNMLSVFLAWSTRLFQEPPTPVLLSLLPSHLDHGCEL